MFLTNTRLVHSNILLHPSFKSHKDELMLPPAPIMTPPQPMPTPAEPSTIEKLRDAQKNFVAIAPAGSDLRVYKEFLNSAECDERFKSTLMTLLAPHLLDNIPH
jgi:hypothetical protein